MPDRRAPAEPWERQKRSGWETYRRAIDLLERDEWALALRMLAAAETDFRTDDDHDGLWRALSGQAAAHWGAGDAHLAVARATAALRTAESVGDIEGAGLAAWQLAVMLLAQGDYRWAAELLLRSEEALVEARAQVPAAEVGTAARLCMEILRWQQMVSQGVAERRTATDVVTAIQRDLLVRLTQAAAALRAHAGLTASGTWSTHAVLLPVSAGPPSLPERELARPSLGVRLARWWRQLTQSEPDEPSTSPVTALAPLALTIPRLAEPARTTPAPARAMPESGQAVPEPARAAPEPAVAVETPPAPAPAPDPPPPAAAPEEPIALPAQAIVAHPGARIAISCFGQFRVTIDNRPVERWESNRARTILKYLVARSAAPVSKELLAGLFWPESEPELARRSLHQAIYCLRQSLKRVAPDLVLIRFADDCYQISPDVSLWVDSEEFTRAIGEARARLAAGARDAAIAAYAMAADLVAGEYLEDERYEAWAEELRQTYRSMYSEALHRLAGYYHERGEHPTAILHCQRILAQEPCDEEAHLLLMRSYVAQGLRHLAVRQYQICSNALRNELGLTPSEELESFYRRVVAVE